MVLIVHGFPTKVQGLQFEWCWQKPKLSSRVREARDAHGSSGSFLLLPCFPFCLWAGRHKGCRVSAITFVLMKSEWH